MTRNRICREALQQAEDEAKLEGYLEEPFDWQFYGSEWWEEEQYPAMRFHLAWDETPLGAWARKHAMEEIGS